MSKPNGENRFANSAINAAMDRARSANDAKASEVVIAGTQKAKGRKARKPQGHLIRFWQPSFVTRFQPKENGVDGKRVSETNDHRFVGGIPKYEGRPTSKMGDGKTRRERMAEKAIARAYYANLAKRRKFHRDVDRLNYQIYGLSPIDRKVIDTAVNAPIVGRPRFVPKVK